MSARFMISPDASGEICGVIESFDSVPRFLGGNRMEVNYENAGRYDFRTY